ncbi:MAG TPA: PaaI family thioesterase [Solirubrobacterales bacterium]|nr:PaaI family thioesterase [Solirubrobacterales bacterium]
MSAADAAVVAAEDFAARSPETTRSRTLTWQDPLASAAAGAELAGIDYLRAIVAGEIPPPPIAVMLRAAPVEIADGRVIFEGHPGEEHYNPIGVVHGGYASTLLDSVIGCAVHTTLPAGVAYATLTLEVKFVRPITGDTGAVRAEAEVIHRGRRQATAEAKLVAADSGKLLAHATSTCMILGAP